MKKRSTKTIIILSVLFAVLLVAVLLFLRAYPKDRRQDYKRLSQENYDSVYLSMYPIENFTETDYSYYRGYTTVLTKYEIPDSKVLADYLKVIAKSGNSVHTIYLGIRPELTDLQELTELTAKYPSVSFEIVPAYPKAAYWQAMSDEELVQCVATYRELSEKMVSIDNASVYFFSGKEWLVCNESNYTDSFTVNSDIAETIMVHSDRGHQYVITEKNCEEFVREFEELLFALRNNPVQYPDLEDYTFVFFGDSIIGNYTNTSSIPAVVGGLTGARSYNLGWGGKSAAASTKELFSFADLARSFVEKDFTILPEDKAIYNGMNQYAEEHPDENKLVFVISFGLNDYFSGHPVYGTQENDTSSFSGALRSGIKILKEAYPQAEFLLCTPTFTTYFEYGTLVNEEGGLLTDYVDAVLALSDELSVKVFDGYHELGINRKNEAEFLIDGCHFNETGRFLVGSRIALLFP